jgi:glucosamine--fructose-6-phosphate aminotransferase (isomerizing)
MCGITGIIKFSHSSVCGPEVVAAWESMFASSLRRGSDSSGLIAVTQTNSAVFKCSSSVTKLLENKGYKSLKDSLDLASSLLLIGHSRLATNGTSKISKNNQPVVHQDMGLLHNGIVVNDVSLRQEYGFPSDTALDSDLLAQMLYQFEVHKNPARALKKLFSLIHGNSTLAITLGGRGSCIIATNNGSMYTLYNQKAGIFLFSSEPSFIEMGRQKLDSSNFLVTQLKPGEFIEIPLNEPVSTPINAISYQEESSVDFTPAFTSKLLFSSYKDYSSPEIPDFDQLIRCSKCIIPTTFPGIEFNEQGECSFCAGNSPRPKELLGVENLLFDLGISKESYTGNPVIVGVSGGRDSCYGLHFLVKILRIKVIAYTYDWGMVTDLARRNIARICGDLGIEHIIIAPDLKSKLRNIRLNLSAWIKKPDLGLIPLMMAGDKQFFYYAGILRKERKADSIVLCAGNTFETTFFKTAFAGVKQQSNRGVLTDTSKIQSLKLLRYYIFGVLKNPRYFNISIWDSLKAFWSSYFLKDEYVYLFNYIEWDEHLIMETLKNEYDWENAEDTSATWRIGDGTSSFYNYVYYSVAGFTESDTFRSNQIRAGVLSRSDALLLVKAENKPRYEALNEYAAKIGINAEALMQAIHSMKKLWK